MQGRTADLLLRYGFAAFVTLAATWARVSLDSVIDDRLPFGLFYVSVFVSAWLGGVGPALFALCLGVFCAAHFIIEPRNSLLFTGAADLLSLVIYFVVGLMAVLLLRRLSRLRRLAENRASENASLNDGLRLADHRKDEFLALLAHELRNPLAPVRTGLDLLARCEDEPAEVHRIRRMLTRQVEQLVQIVDDLLDVSHYIRGQLTLTRSPIDLRKIVEMALESVRPQLDAQAHSLTVLLPETAVMVDGDRVRLVQVVSNLLGNAAKYTPRNGRIRVVLEQEQEAAILSVIDNGIGIADADRQRIFELFAQADTSESKDFGGLGLGLAIVKRLTELHGGTIAVDSRGPGHGSRFVVTLPVEEAADESASGLGDSVVGMAIPREALQAASADRRVLIVDDNADAAESLSHILSFEGYRTLIAADGATAINLCRQFHPHVILLDIGLPGMDGYEVAEQLRRRPQFAQTPIIAVTGWGAEADRQRSAQVGINHHLLKPVVLTELLDVLTNCFDEMLDYRMPAESSFPPLPGNP